MAEDVKLKLDSANVKLETAQSWGKWDIFAGGTIISMMKRNKIKSANQVSLR